MSKSRRPVTESGTRDQEHLFGDARHRLAVERHTRIRPPAAARASARATSTAAWIARTRGLSVDRRARASASERTVWAAASLDKQTRAAATQHERVRIRLLEDRQITGRRLASRVMWRGRRGVRGAESGREADRESESHCQRTPDRTAEAAAVRSPHSRFAVGCRSQAAPGRCRRWSA